MLKIPHTGEGAISEGDKFKKLTIFRVEYSINDAQPIYEKFEDTPTKGK